MKRCRVIEDEHSLLGIRGHRSASLFDLCVEFQFDGAPFGRDVLGGRIMSAIVGGHPFYSPSLRPW